MSPYFTPGVFTACTAFLSALAVYLLNHKSGSYKDELKNAMKEELTIQTTAIVKTQVECKDEIVGAIKALKA